MAIRRVFGLLGPLEARVDGRLVEVSTPKLRVLLAALLAHANRPVPVDRLIEYLWGDQAPASARKTLQIYVLRLRRLLADDPRRPALILTRADSYLIAVDDDQLDLAVFTAAVAAAEGARGAAEQAELLDRAEECWRGPALVDVPADALHREVAPWLAEERVRAAERRIRAHLELGRHREVVGELTRLTREHPWREPLWEQLITALHRSGRQAEALAAFQAVDQRFRTEMGLDVGPELRRAHQAVLADERPAVVGQLPADVRGFAGRRAELADVAALLRAEESGSPPIVVVSGPPGVGKTAFAVRLAHRLRGQFPDGQLYVDLRGFAEDAPLAPADVLGRFLGALGIARERLPDGLDDRSALFRGLLADRRMLVVLDNAASPCQVLPLLPGIPGAAVLITSRDDLRALGVRQSVDRVRLPELDPASAVEVLVAQIGPDRAPPGVLARLAALCGHLPLALRIAGANLAADPHRGVPEYAAELAGPDRLALLSVDGDEDWGVVPAFERSCSALRPGDRAALGALAVAGQFRTAEAAELLGTGLLAVRQVLDRLTASNLLHRCDADRFCFPELIREFAAGSPVEPQLACAG